MSATRKPGRLRPHARSFLASIRQFLTPDIWKDAHHARHARSSQELADLAFLADLLDPHAKARKRGVVSPASAVSVN